MRVALRKREGYANIIRSIRRAGRAMLMIRMSVLLFITASVLALSGCTSQMNIRAQPKADQKTVYEAGQPIMLSDKQYSVAVSQASSLVVSNEPLRFLVHFANTLNKPINFGPTNITASLNGHPIRVLTYEEIISQMERERNSQAFAAALAGMAQSISATGQQQHYGTMSSQYYGTQGYIGHGVGTYSGTSYNPTAAAVAKSNIQANTQKNVNTIRQYHNQKVANARASLLATETVYPGSMHGGYIRTEPLYGNSASGTLNITVTIGGERHSFDFAVKSN